MIASPCPLSDEALNLLSHVGTHNARCRLESSEEGASVKIWATWGRMAHGRARRAHRSESGRGRHADAWRPVPAVRDFIPRPAPAEPMAAAAAADAAPMRAREIAARRRWLRTMGGLYRAHRLRSVVLAMHLARLRRYGGGNPKVDAAVHAWMVEILRNIRRSRAAR